jgi:replication factor C subunit 2/4
MLFYGPPGTGKTSTVLALARDLFGPQLYRTRLLELNASDERGIDVIREKVKNFAKTTAKDTVPGYPCPPFKLILLDEADSLTGDAQTALRRVMELYSKGTRFCLVCNYVSRIIEPLTSRCAKFRFRPVEESAGLVKVRNVCVAEGVQLVEGDETLLTLLRIAGGDLRRAITLLQSAHRLGLPVSMTTISELSGIIPDSLIQRGYSLCQTEDALSMIEFVRTEIIRGAYSGQQFVKQLGDLVAGDPTLATARKAMLGIRFARKDYLLHDGADEMLQIMDLMGYCQKVISGNSVSAF